MEDYKIPGTPAQGDQSTMTGTPNPNKPAKKGKGKKIALIVVIVLILVAAGAGAAWMLSGEDSGSSSSKMTPTPTRSATPTPTPTPAAREVEKADVKIEILNGTGVPGEASLLQAELEDLGYETIETGNADTTDFTATEVVFASDLPSDIVDEITGVLNEMYESVKVTKGSSGAFDVQITTGKRTGASTTGTPTPTKATSTSTTPTSSATTKPSTSPTPTI